MLLVTQINVSILFSLVIRLILNESRLNLKLAYEKSIFFSALNHFFLGGGGGDCTVNSHLFLSASLHFLFV